MPPTLESVVTDIRTVYVLVPLVILAYVYHRRVSKRRSYPPGPPGLPLIGNILQLNLEPWKIFTAWGEKYGPVVYLEVFGQKVVVINTLKAAHDLLDVQSNIYSDRPRNVVCYDYMTDQMTFNFMGLADPRLKPIRRITHKCFSQTASMSYDTVRHREAIVLIESMLKHTDDLLHYAEKVSCSMMLSILYGRPSVTSWKDPILQSVNDFVRRLAEAALPGKYLVEFFPWMGVIPMCMAPWKRQLYQNFQKDDSLFYSLRMGAIAQAKRDGKATNTSAMLEEQKSQYNEFSERNWTWLLTAFYTGGTETVSSSISWFILAMLVYPEVQKKAQEELDSVVGRSRMPIRSDMEHLPYIQAIVKEVIRWRTVVPIGMPHYAREDNMYEGHLIPKGSIMLASLWSMHRDQNIYGPDASEFNPDRWIKKTYNPNLLDIRSDGHAGFGFGKRECPGRRTAVDSMEIITSCILWALKMEQKRDPTTGKLIPLPSPEEYPIGGITIHPIPFQFTATPRFEDVREIIESSKESLA